MEKRVVITGMGVISPNGCTYEECWQNLFGGKSFVEQDEIMNLMKIKSNVNCKVKKFRLEDFVEKGEFYSEVKKQDRFIQLGVAASKKAIEDSEINSAEIRGEDIGIIFSSAIGGTPTIQNIFEELSDKGQEEITYKPIGEYFYNAGMVNYPAILIAHEYGFKNICTSISTGCTGGIDTIGMAYDTIKNSKAKVMLAGASEAPLTNITYATLDIIGALSVADGEPHTRSRPFDKKRAGFVIAEGSACLVLEELEHALDRNANIYGEVIGYSSVNNAFHMTDLKGDGESMAKAIELALDDANTKPTEIDYINAHGSSTPQNDLYETNAFKKAFGEHAYNIPISSCKSMIGHSLSSASLMGVLAAIGSFRYSKIHPTINLKNKDEKCDLDYVPNVSRNRDVKKAMITASGFGGIHSVGIFNRYNSL